MMVQFSSNETVSLDKRVDSAIRSVHTKLEDINSTYEIEKCAEWIRSNEFKKVCLQFPDYLLPDSTEVAQRLQATLGQTVYVMGDTSYESCCVDYVAAAHITADAVIHFGPMCFSTASGNLPCLMIYEKEPMNVSTFKDAFDQQFPVGQEVVVLVDTPYMIHLDAIERMFRSRRNFSIYSVIRDDVDLQTAVTIFIGGNQRKIMNLKLSFRPKELYYYDPAEPPQFINYEQDSKILKRRYFLVEKIKDSNTIGIIIGTLAVRNYLRVIERLKKLVRISGKKYYVISVGKPTIAKLANFPEIDIYVMVTCAMNEVYDSRDFYKPVVTPFDVELALNPQARNAPFSYDYNTYFVEGDLELDVETLKATEGDVSLITGRVRSNRTEGEHDQVVEACDTQVALKTEGTVALGSSVGARFLMERSWKGLEQNLGQDQPEMAAEGQRGIAQGYENESSQPS